MTIFKVHFDNWSVITNIADITFLDIFSFTTKFCILLQKKTTDWKKEQKILYPLLP